MKLLICAILGLVFVTGTQAKCFTEELLFGFDFEAAIKTPPIGKAIKMSDLQKPHDYVAIMYHGEMPKLCREFFEETKSVSVVMLLKTQISSINEDTFNGLKTLEHLKIHDAQHLVSIAEGTVQNMPEFESFDIGFSALKNIDEGAFKNLPKLTEVSVTYSRLEAVIPTWFIKCPKIHTVDFSHNNIRTLREGDFIFLNPSEAHTVDLQYNKIRTIEEGAFHSTEHFKSLNLEGNHLMTFSSNVFPHLNPAKDNVIDLSGNRFTCIDDKTSAALKMFEKINFDDNYADDTCHKETAKKGLKEISWN